MSHNVQSKATTIAEVVIPFVTSPWRREGLAFCYYTWSWCDSDSSDWLRIYRAETSGVRVPKFVLHTGCAESRLMVLVLILKVFISCRRSYTCRWRDEASFLVSLGYALSFGGAHVGWLMPGRYSFSISFLATKYYSTFSV